MLTTRERRTQPECRVADAYDGARYGGASPDPTAASYSGRPDVLGILC
jgi:hypothetical protein